MQNLLIARSRGTELYLPGDLSLYPPNDADRGDVWWLNSSAAFAQRLAYINGQNRVVLKVDNSSVVPLNQKRNSVRIETHDTYGVGSLWIVDIAHVPFGCSVSLGGQILNLTVYLLNGLDLFRFGLRFGHMVSCY